MPTPTIPEPEDFDEILEWTEEEEEAFLEIVEKQEKNLPKEQDGNN